MTWDILTHGAAFFAGACLAVPLYVAACIILGVLEGVVDAFRAP